MQGVPAHLKFLAVTGGMETSEEVFSLLIDIVRKRGIGALIATHNMDFAHEMDRILEVNLINI